jgi:hypothetical protein
VLRRQWIGPARTFDALVLDVLVAGNEIIRHACRECKRRAVIGRLRGGSAGRRPDSVARRHPTVKRRLRDPGCTCRGGGLAAIVMRYSSLGMSVPTESCFDRSF